ncbi:hypothetical protein [Streptomyces sp. NPDC050416]|uniref:hypothetical protein n=1 Tax=Streptomyces sp. NPDC050416 TaxID=3365611 RepID=UPI00379DE29E
MDLQGIGALAAAAVAAVGIPAALVVGRWQMRAALRAAEQTARAGMAQAEASYKAALDAVRASADETHAQWLRDTRRQAYSSFLLACHEALTASLALRENCGTQERYDRYEALEDEVRAASTKAHTAELVVRLEGPDSVSLLATHLVGLLDSIIRDDNYMANLAKARPDLELLVEEEGMSSPYGDLLNAVITYQFEARNEPARGAYHWEEDVPDELAAAWKAVQQARFRIPFPHRDLAELVTAESRHASWEARNRRDTAAREWDEAQRNYVATVRELLSAPASR